MCPSSAPSHQTHIMSIYDSPDVAIVLAAVTKMYRDPNPQDFVADGAVVTGAGDARAALDWAPANDLIRVRSNHEQLPSTRRIARNGSSSVQSGDRKVFVLTHLMWGIR